MITGTVTVNNITILNGASVTISMGAELIVNDVTGPGAIINQGRLAIQGNNLHTHPDPYGGTVSYTSGGAQLIRYHKYQNIELQNGLKNITGDILLTGNFYCYTSCNVINSDVTIAGNYYNNGLLIASGTSTFKFNNNTTDQIIGGNGIHIFQNLEISKSPGGRLILQDSIQINGQLIWTGDGVLALSSNNLVIGPLATFVNTGTYGPTRMIETDGLDNTSGMIIRKGLNPIDFNNLTIPIGSNGKYTPVWLKRIRIAGPTNIDSRIALKVVQDNVCNNCVRRFLRMQASDMIIDSVDFQFNYPKSEKVGYPSKVFRVVSGIPNPVS
ncbi:MAG: hypothetical protein NZ529_11095, partial [Cytophagaceae bacterium]|nr:hypothetical protein [Cytophagaceae bacterium]MDW8457330.1 hypothetical protein [Cytophagaceae bacterium]